MMIKVRLREFRSPTMWHKVYAKAKRMERVSTLLHRRFSITRGVSNPFYLLSIDAPIQTVRIGSVF